MPSCQKLLVSLSPLFLYSEYAYLAHHFWFLVTRMAIISTHFYCLPWSLLLRTQFALKFPCTSSSRCDWICSYFCYSFFPFRIFSIQKWQKEDPFLMQHCTYWDLQIFLKFGDSSIHSLATSIENSLLKINSSRLWTISRIAHPRKILIYTFFNAN